MRAKDLATVVFARRLLADDSRPAADLKYLVERGADRALVRSAYLVVYGAQTGRYPRLCR